MTLVVNLNYSYLLALVFGGMFVIGGIVVHRLSIEYDDFEGLILASGLYIAGGISAFLLLNIEKAWIVLQNKSSVSQEKEN